MKNKLKQLNNNRKERKLAKQEASDRLPRITNETVAEHREEVLSGARKYIYPLQHSKHKIVIVTTTLFILAFLSFTTYCVVSLYKLQNTSTFLYRVTQVVPFPVARSGTKFVSYESYLFELRHYMHYYETQQKIGFDTESGKQQLDDYKRRSLDKVINDSIIKQIASERGITVTDQEIDAQIASARNQNRLGGSSRVFEDVIKEYYGWTLGDFKRSIKASLLEQKVTASLDEEAKAKLDAVQAELNNGKPFADVAKQYSDDEATKAAGGDFGTIDKANTAASPQTTDVLFAQPVGAVSQPIVISYDTGYAYEVVKTNEVTGDKAKGAHIIVRLKDINVFLNDRKDKQPARRYIRL